MKTFQDLVAEAKQQIREISPEELAAKHRAGDSLILIDVREEVEHREEKIPFAQNMPRGYLEIEISKQVTDPEAQIICHCGGGGRSSLATKTLQEMGYRNVVSLAGGLRAWKEKGFPVELRQG